LKTFLPPQPPPVHQTNIPQTQTTLIHTSLNGKNVCGGKQNVILCPMMILPGNECK